MARLADTLQRVLEGYTGEALNGYSYLTASSDHKLFTVVSIGQAQGKQIVDTGLVVRLHNNRIIIERDVNNKMLVDALLEAGIPRRQIVLAYMGEAAEE